jgi:hypothetical protein
MRKARLFIASVIIFLAPCVSVARNGFTLNWPGMLTNAERTPHWITPLATTAPRHEQEFGYEYRRLPRSIRG